MRLRSETTHPKQKDDVYSLDKDLKSHNAHLRDHRRSEEMREKCEIMDLSRIGDHAKITQEVM